MKKKKKFSKKEIEESFSSKETERIVKTMKLAIKDPRIRKETVSIIKPEFVFKGFKCPA